MFKSRLVERRSSPVDIRIPFDGSSGSRAQCTTSISEAPKFKLSLHIDMRVKNCEFAMCLHDLHQANPRQAKDA